MRYADVIVPLAVEGMYTYTVPVSLESEVREGTLVLVSFAGNKRYTALVGRIHDQAPVGYQVKPIEDVIEKQVSFSALHLRFLLWLGGYYMATPGEVMKAALPVAFRLESFTSITRTTEEVDYAGLTTNEKILLRFLQPGEYVSLKEAEKYLKIKNGLPLVRNLLARNYIQIKETVDDLFREKKERIVTWAKEYTEEELGALLDRLKRAPAQYAMLCRWIEWGKTEIEKGEWLRLTGQSAATLKGLCDRAILKVEERKISRLGGDGDAGGSSWQLNAEQQGALGRIRDFFLEKDCVLLQGVTSSGKTEVYIRLIQEYLNRGQQVLYMLPEIALTVQIVRRLQRVFGDRIGIYHSGMSDNMRAELWRKQCSDEPFQLILGVRSSVFLPFRNLGLIIVDEEHDASYKQKEPAPRYNGRDAAVMLGKLSKGSFSPLLLEEMEKVLSEHKQVILFQNRRGYSSYVQCDRCGEIPKCRYCDVSLTYYKQRHVLVCRYCGAIVSMSDRCSVCGEGHYRERTPGTERIEEEVLRLFPQARVARMDLDVMSSKSRFRSVIEDFEQGKTDILIGTQMVTKGLDFANVKLVGVIDADSMVNFPDFRAEERVYCMLLQVSGRSGRKGDRGKVVIQAADVKNRVYTMLTDGNYRTFFEQLAAERELFVYPPFGRMIQVELRHKEVVPLRNAANRLAVRLRGQLGKRVCGPAVPEISKIGGYHRLILLLKLENGISCSGVKNRLREEIRILKQEKQWGTLRVICDVDPQ